MLLGLMHIRHLCLRLLCLVGTLSCCVGCRDNATQLAYRVVESAEALSAQQDGASATVRYNPVSNASSPFTVVVFPARDVQETELVGAGMPPERAREILSDLAYLGTTANLMIVDQDGERLKFTTYWRRGAKAHDVVMSRPTTGTLGVRLRKEDGVVWITAFE